jgi:hypothetical protein
VLRSSHPSNETYSFHKEELGNTSLSPRASALVYSFLVFTLLLVSYLLHPCHIGKFTIVTYLGNLPLCQALIEKELKIGVAPIYPPSRSHTLYFHHIPAPEKLGCANPAEYDTFTFSYANTYTTNLHVHKSGYLDWWLCRLLIKWHSLDVDNLY